MNRKIAAGGAAAVLLVAAGAGIADWISPDPCMRLVPAGKLLPPKDTWVTVPVGFKLIKGTQVKGDCEAAEWEK